MSNFRVQKHLNQSGFDHIFGAALCFVVVGLVGTFMLVASRAYTVHWKGTLEEGSANSGFCLTTNGSTNGASVALDPCGSTSTTSQNWSLNYIKHATVLGAANVQEFSLQSSSGSTECLNDPYGSKTNGVALQLYTCHSNDNNNLWVWGGSLTGKGYGYHELINVASNLCIDDAYGSHSAANKVQLWNCTKSGPANQSWFEHPATGGGTTGGSGGGTSSPPSGRFGMALGSGFENDSSTNLNSYFADMSSIGTQWVRFDMQWSSIQSSNNGSYNWTAYDNVVKAAQAHNLKVLGILDAAPSWAQQPSCAGQYSCPPNGTSNFATFAAAAATHFKSHGVTTFEIYNEQNTGTFWSNPSASAYTALLKAAYTAIHRAEPGDFVVSGGLAPSGGGGYIVPNTYVQQMYAAGVKGYFDALGDHPYCFSDPVSYCATNNSGSTDGWGMMAYGPNNILSIMRANGDGGKKIWMTEFGADSNYTPAQVAQMMQQAFSLTNGQSWAGPIFWYTYLNGDGFGLIGSNGQPTAAYTEYKHLTGK